MFVCQKKYSETELYTLLRRPLHIANCTLRLKSRTPQIILYFPHALHNKNWSDELTCKFSTCCKAGLYWLAAKLNFQQEEFCGIYQILCHCLLHFCISLYFRIYPSARLCWRHFWLLLCLDFLANLNMFSSICCLPARSCLAFLHCELFPVLSFMTFDTLIF